MARAANFHIVYPHQLFEEVFALPEDTHVLVVEDPLFFGDRRYPRHFHKHKLVLHRASMRAFADRLQQHGFRVAYFEFADTPTPKHLADWLVHHHAASVSVFDPTDSILSKRLTAAFRGKPWRYDVHASPNFLTSMDDIQTYFKGKRSFFMHTFYQFQRKRLNILVDDHGKPEGGKWSYDSENRKRLPKTVAVPKAPHFAHNAYVTEAIAYVNTHFPNNPGEAKQFNFPIDHRAAKRALNHFLDHRFANFGAYEDATARDESILFHSALSAPLNIGLLSPREVINAALARHDRVPLASLEGFIRQIIGWREFMRAMYVLHGTRMRTHNALGHTRRLPSSWYDGTTGIDPIDATIHKVLRHAYCHHIERLMVLGNAMLLLEIHPDDIYGWFMDMFIDAYDWVMVPNVYAMSQFADGGTLTTKPYFSASNYIRTMSDYPRGPWCDVWDALFYRFLARHRKLIAANPRSRMLLKHLDRLSPEQRVAMQRRIKTYFTPDRM